ncbi:hypothetical protein D3C85_816170 [compost metagenome]
MTLMPLSKMSALVGPAQSGKWETFPYNDERAYTHICPVYQNGLPRIGHTLDLYCKCHPVMDKVAGNVLIHNDVLD